jgi:PhnB protein
MSKVKPIPDGYSTVTPHLVCKGAAAAIEFYKKAFGAEELRRSPMPGTPLLMHAELKIGNSRVMLADEFPGQGEDCGGKSPQTLGGTAVTLHLYVEDTDAMFARAVKAGATATMPPWDAFWGDRYCQVKDPFGHSWAIATHNRDLTPDQMQKEAAAAFAKFGKKS